MDDEELIDGYVPPRKNDVLFRDHASDWWNNACLNVTYSDEYGYSEGYRRSARLLVEYVNENARDQDYLVYPIIFLYRHHVELALKNIIAISQYVLGREFTDAEKRHLGGHRLDLLWEDLKPMFADVCRSARWQPLDPVDLEGVDSYLRQLSELDPDSYRFRYTRSKKGEPSLPPELKNVNLRRFAELVERLADYLDGLDAAAAHLEDLKTEMQAEQRSG